MSPRRKIRCAIYTRKSSEDGLDQDFNSLDAQYEACAAYIASQRHEGWTLFAERYDDGGLSGGTLERPALQRLLEEIDAGRIDMVVVYKIDRLTRSLADFSKLVERLEQANCSFVSVTQAFNTSSSMGRLTLNVLLSFAQFEREVTAERIRDKIAASKKKGLWIGGNLPLGYDSHPDPKSRTLVVNEDEAKTVRRLFGLYDELGCLRKVEERATAEGLRSKRVVRADGSMKGNCPLSRGQIYHLLRNPVYLGKIRHKDKIWDGQHVAVIDQGIWDRVQEKMRQVSNRSRARGLSDPCQHSNDPGAWLTGLLQDETGDRLTPTHTTRKGRRLRYYISNRLISGGKDISGWRLPGPTLENAIINVIVRHLQDAAAAHQVLAQPEAGSAEAVQTSVADLVTRLQGQGGQVGADILVKGRIARGKIDLELNTKTLASALGIAADHLHPDLTHITASFDLRRRGVEAKVIAGDMAPQLDPHLRSMLIRAHGWACDLKAGVQLMEIARRESVPGAFIRTRAQLAFLSPKIQAAILEGTQPPELTLKRLVSVTHPLDWTEQERLFGC